MSDVAMPRLSDSMEEGTILKWLKSDGDEVSKGEELVEIETDKANMTYEADEAGTLEIVAKEGDTLAVGETIARIGEGGGGTTRARTTRSPRRRSRARTRSRRRRATRREADDEGRLRATKRSPRTSPTRTEDERARGRPKTRPRTRTSPRRSESRAQGGARRTASA